LKSYLKFDRLNIPTYPQEFFTVLNYLVNSLEFLKDFGLKLFDYSEIFLDTNAVKTFGRDIVKDILVGGRYRRVGRCPFNLQKLRTRCMELLDGLPSPLGELIEHCYLDDQLNLFLENLWYIERLIRLVDMRKKLTKFEEQTKSFIRDLKDKTEYNPFNLLRREYPPFVSEEEMKIIVQREIYKKADYAFSYFSLRKNMGDKIINKYLNIIRERLIDDLAGGINVECLCHLYHEFPSERIEGTKLVKLSNYVPPRNIREIPDEQTYKTFSSLFNIPLVNLKRGHQAVMDVCRENFIKEFRESRYFRKC
jgi:hypothetical protein